MPNKCTIPCLKSTRRFDKPEQIQNPCIVQSQCQGEVAQAPQDQTVQRADNHYETE